MLKRRELSAHRWTSVGTVTGLEMLPCVDRAMESVRVARVTNHRFRK